VRASLWVLRRLRAAFCRPDPGNGECCHEGHVRDGSLMTALGREQAHFVGTFFHALRLRWPVPEALARRCVRPRSAGPQKVLGWKSWKTLVWVWAYPLLQWRSRGYEHPTIRRRITSCHANFRAYLLVGWLAHELRQAWRIGTLHRQHPCRRFFGTALQFRP
jgi:hypothetical protein